MVRRPYWRARRGREALPKGAEGVGRPFWRVRWAREVWERSGVHPEGMGRDKRPSCRVRKGQEAFAEGLEGSGDPPKESGLLGRPGKVGSPSRRAGRGKEGRKKLEILPREWGGFRRPFWRARRVREDIQEGQEGSVGPFKGTKRVGRSSQRARRNRESLPECREGLGGLGGLVVPQEGREDWEAFLEGLEWSGEMEKVGSPSRRVGRGWKSLPKGWEE